MSELGMMDLAAFIAIDEALLQPECLVRKRMARPTSS